MKLDRKQDGGRPRGTSAGHGTNGHAADQINKLKSKALAHGLMNASGNFSATSDKFSPSGQFDSNLQRRTDDVKT